MVWTSLHLSHVLKGGKQFFMENPGEPWPPPALFTETLSYPCKSDCPRHRSPSAGKALAPSQARESTGKRAAATEMGWQRVPSFQHPGPTCSVLPSLPLAETSRDTAETRCAEGPVTAPRRRRVAMAYSTCCRVAMVSCLVLCVSLLLPRTFLSRGGGRQEPGAAPLAAPAPPEGKLGRFPPRMHYQATPDSRAAPHFPRSHLAEAVAKAKAGGGSGGSAGGTGRGLVGQIIPIYGFGIFLYILYILFKLASKGRTIAGERKCPTAAPGNLKRKITDYELTQLQEKLRETEEAMEKLINRVGPNCDSRTQNVTTDQEKRLLQQLREITRVMKEGKFIDGISPEKEAEEAPYMEDWEGYPEETYPVYDNSDHFKRKQDTILVDYPDLSQPSAEELAERMEGMEDEEHLCNETLLTDLTVRRDSHDLMQKKDEVTGISEEERDLHHSQSTEECCCCYEDDDPAVIAENAGFHSESCSEAEESTQEDPSVESENENAALKKQKASDSDETGTLRKRNTKGLE